ncbi:hypothetical protein N7535_008993 [Penicillium sp. DV-2018c]|nr:hypothetical protein N7461_003115 [Penicillium sp. DV-2018c]KAJ5560796.1 hypothetical protein N7535_008993 [Penicillium sp. DV-2018c]
MPPSYNNCPLPEPALDISPQPPTASTLLPSRELSTEGTAYTWSPTPAPPSSISQSQKKPLTLAEKAILCQVAADHQQEWVTPGNTEFFKKVTSIFIEEASRPYSFDSAKRNILRLIEKRRRENLQPQTGVSQEDPAKVEMNEALDRLIERQNQLRQAEAATLRRK